MPYVVTSFKCLPFNLVQGIIVMINFYISIVTEEAVIEIPPKPTLRCRIGDQSSCKDEWQYVIQDFNLLCIAELKNKDQKEIEGDHTGKEQLLISAFF